jgi:hypothetical protein
VPSVVQFTLFLSRSCIIERRTIDVAVFHQVAEVSAQYQGDDPGQRTSDTPNSAELPGHHMLLTKGKACCTTHLIEVMPAESYRSTIGSALVDRSADALVAADELIE